MLVVNRCCLILVLFWLVFCQFSCLLPSLFKHFLYDVVAGNMPCPRITDTEFLLRGSANAEAGGLLLESVDASVSCHCILISSTVIVLLFHSLCVHRLLLCHHLHCPLYVVPWTWQDRLRTAIFL